jgi:hypothetical protein
MTEHIVQDGETLIGLASRYGLESWQEILDHPRNAELKAKRPDPGVLRPGDELYIPNPALRREPSAIDAEHKFKVARPKAWIRIAVKGADGAALTGQPYTLSAGGKKSAGVVPADGVLEMAVPVDVTSGTLTVGGETWTLQIGSMTPLDGDDGVLARLHNLGFDTGDPEADVRAFQARVGLEPTGTVDDALRDKLAAYYDPAKDERQQEAK